MPSKWPEGTGFEVKWVETDDGDHRADGILRATSTRTAEGHPGLVVVSDDVAIEVPASTMRLIMAFAVDAYLGAGSEFLEAVLTAHEARMVPKKEQQ